MSSFGVQPVYGWEFFDPPDSSWQHWRNHLSLDVHLLGGWGGPDQHVLDVSKET